MIPWEREIYIEMLVDEIKKERDAYQRQQMQG